MGGTTSSETTTSGETTTGGATTGQGGAGGDVGGSGCVAEVTAFFLRDDQTVWEANQALDQILVADSEEPLSGAVDIVSGTRYGCAVDDQGDAWCWSGAGAPDNSFGELGDNLPTATYVDFMATPVLRQPDTGTDPVPLEGIVALASGADECLGSTNCAITDAGGLWCWGRGNQAMFNSLSGSVNASRIAVPIHSVADTPLLDVDQVSVLRNHICIVSGGSVSCWGTNTYGRLGVGDEAARTYPTQVSLAGPAAKVAVGESMSCALLQDGTVWCWGFNRYGQLGIGDPLAEENDDGCVYGCKLSPAQVTTETAFLDGIVDLAVGVEGPLGGSAAAIRDSVCALKNDGSIWCWGQDHGNVATELMGPGARPVVGAQTLAMCVGELRYVDADGVVFEEQVLTEPEPLQSVCAEE